MIERGVLYIAFGEAYRSEVLASISALRRFHPRLPCCVITDSHLDALPNDVHVLHRERETGNYPTRAKPRYMLDSPFDRTLFLDTDTTAVRPIEDLFLLLDRFDIGVYVTPRYLHYQKYGYLPYL